MAGCYAGSVVADQHTDKQVSSPSSRSDVSADVYLLVQRLQQEVRDLRGQIEELNYRAKRSAKQERERYIDLDRRILELSNSLNQNPPAVKSAQSPAVTNQDAPADLMPVVVVESGEAAKKEYKDAYNLIKHRRYDEAVEALHKFIKKYPESDLTSNAYYWLGEVYLVLHKHEQARQSFIVVIGKYPDHRKASDAYYKLGVTYHRLGNKEEAISYFKQTIEKHPDSSAASLAKSYLKRI